LGLRLVKLPPLLQQRRALLLGRPPALLLLLSKGERAHHMRVLSLLTLLLRPCQGCDNRHAGMQGAQLLVETRRCC
jgi:hypothetical protein